MAYFVFEIGFSAQPERSPANNTQRNKRHVVRLMCFFSINGTLPGVIVISGVHSWLPWIQSRVTGSSASPRFYVALCTVRLVAKPVCCVFNIYSLVALHKSPIVCNDKFFVVILNPFCLLFNGEFVTNEIMPDITGFLTF